ncbi:hypothetical protein Nepgr_027207 [Nepenthes gracilis]|uniref:Uncharacterized protein n=1 Tax=Nepenthes gracilis TaxID=150966 RepID=A0AAD3Y2W1_NEPGR|nr:hypothetical protein Nepgr_027207 [Nepenthes gracilis]
MGCKCRRHISGWLVCFYALNFDSLSSLLGVKVSLGIFRGLVGVGLEVVRFGLPISEQIYALVSWAGLKWEACDLAVGSDKPLTEAIVSDPPPVVAGDCQAVLAVPADAPGISNVVDDVGCDSLDTVGLPLVDSVIQASDGTPFMALDQSPVVKRVRFAPEIASAEAPSCDPHRRLLAPCSDICHPSKFRRSNLGNLASMVVPVDDGPNPDAAIEHHVLSIPPSDGVSPVLEPASVIDPDLTPSPISRILKKYVGGSERDKDQSRNKLKPCKSK